MKEFIVKKRITINAKPSQVWDALTNPEKTKKYFFRCAVISKWRIGSHITFKGKIFLVKKIEMKGKILNLEPEKLLQYTLKNGKTGDKAAGTSIITDELTYKNGKTTVTVSDNVGNEVGAEKRYDRSKRGWSKILTGLKKLVEAEE